MATPEAEQVPVRKVLDGVPKLSYGQDGWCPFALCLKSCMDYLGEDYSYEYILGTSGACFRMSWNFTQWDEGNMDLGRLGAEPFRQGLRAVGLDRRFLVKNTWWPDDAADDIQVFGDGAASEAAFREAIIESIGDGRPVLAFGVVGPPEVSIITGYDEGGDVMIGWSCHQGAHPTEQLEPGGAFRQREWFARTEGLIIVEPSDETPDAKQVYSDALDWALRVSLLPKSSTHFFGPDAYKNWAEGMLKDPAFPDDDEEALGSRRFTTWDGLIMLAERGTAASFLEDAAQLHPEIAEHLREAARLFREDGRCGGDINKALGGPTLPSESLADPTARRKAVDGILKARDINAKALEHLALAVGEETGAFAFDGVELDGLRPARRWMTLLGSVQGCLRYIGKDIDDAWVYGITGAAFMLNIDENVDVSGPTSWEVLGDSADPGDVAHFAAMMPHLGVTIGNGIRARATDPDFEDKQAAAQVFIKEKIDADIPCFGWDGGFPEYITINGYDDDRVIGWTHYVDGGYRPCPWDEFGRNDTQNFSVHSVEAVDTPVDDRAAVREALAFAVKYGTPEGPLDTNHAQGLQGYDLWIRCLETGDWLKPGLPGAHHNSACWHECRAYAEAFLRLAGKEVGGDLWPLFEEAANHYREVRKALCELQTIFIYKYPLPPVDEAGVARAIVLLRTARDEEAKGLAVIERILQDL